MSTDPKMAVHREFGGKQVPITVNDTSIDNPITTAADDSLEYFFIVFLIK